MKKVLKNLAALGGISMLLCGCLFVSCSNGDDGDSGTTITKPAPDGTDNENNSGNGNNGSNDNSGNNGSNGDSGNNDNSGNGNAGNSGNSDNNGNSGNSGSPENNGNSGNGSGGGNSVPDTSNAIALPIIPLGAHATGIEGAGIGIHLDNSALKISGATADSFAANTFVKIKDTATQQEVSYNSFQYDDYGAGEATVRLYILLPNAEHTSVDVEVILSADGKVYKGNAVFVNGEYQFDYTLTAITVSASAPSVKPGNQVNFKVKGTPYGRDITSKCTFAIAEGDTTGSSISGTTLTAGTTDGNVQVVVTCGELSETITVAVASDALPTLLSTSKIEGAGIELYIPKDVVSSVPAKEDVTLKGKLTTTDEAFKSYESENLSLTMVEVNDQGDKIRVFFTQPAGFPNGKEITENFEVKWGNVTIKAEFFGNELRTSSIKVEEQA